MSNAVDFSAAFRSLREPSREELRSLQRGDIVRDECGESYIIIDNPTGHSPIAIRTISVTNPQEWRIIKRHDWSL